MKFLLNKFFKENIIEDMMEEIRKREEAKNIDM